MTEAFVTPKMLQWARERNSLTPTAMAAKLQVKPEVVSAWESGHSRPTLRQAQDIAQKLHIPFGYLFLASPPNQTLPMPDLRTIAGQASRAPSLNFYDLLNDVLAKQQWYRDFLENEGVETLPFVGRYDLKDNEVEIANDIRNTLGINTSTRETAKNFEDFLRMLIALAENFGILVLRSGIVGNNTHRSLDVKEFRGFAISDDLAPLIFINSKDGKAAQIFTLGHEIAHIWLGETGVSNPDYLRASSEQGNDIEHLSNRVAAELLVPRDSFLQNWRDHWQIHENMRILANHYKVSRFVILRQALDLGKISQAAYWNQYEQLTGVQNPSGDADNEVSGAGGNFYSSLLARNSATLTKSLLAAVAQGRASYTDAARLLNVRVGKLDDIASHVFGGSLGSG
jgi:Zn-dependent peptidase ImmA (M78 family)/transcriptional regulator with XRE-family HTH domain